MVKTPDVATLLTLSYQTSDTGSGTMTAEHYKTCARRTRLGGLAATLALLELVQILGGPRGEWLRYARGPILHGEWWRLVSGHLVHFDPMHAVMNMAGLVLLWLLFVADARPRQWAIVALVSAVTISLSLWIRHPEVEWYLGLSGVLHGVWAAACIHAFTRWRLEAFVSAALLVAKLLLEPRLGALSTALLGGGLHVVVVAHLYGALGGLLAAVVARFVPEL